MSTHRISCLKQGSTVIDGIASSRLSPGIDLFLGRSDSAIFNRFVAVKQQKPVLTFASKKIATIITALGLVSREILATPLDAYTVWDDQGGSVKTTGEKLSIIKGILVPKSLDLSVGQEATIEYEATAGASDGSAPFSVSDNIAIPSFTSMTEMFTCGYVTVNGSDIGPVKSIRVDFGYEIKCVFGNYTSWPVLVCVKSAQPKITITTLEATALTQLGVQGSANLLTFTALACAQGGSRHVGGELVFSTHLDHIAVQSVGGTSDGDEATTEFLCTPIWDGANAPITLTTVLPTTTTSPAPTSTTVPPSTTPAP